MDDLNWLVVVISVISSAITANAIAYFWYIKYLKKVSEVNEIWLKEVKSTTMKAIDKSQTDSFY